MTTSLTLRYEFSRDDDFGWLVAVVDTPNLQATGGFWVQWQDVEEWASALTRYPISADLPIEEEWGQTENGIYQSIVRIVIAATDSKGQLKATVELADPHDTVFSARTSFRTSYAEVQRFAADVAAMMARRLDEAVLAGRQSV